jgi:ribonuclease D
MNIINNSRDLVEICKLINQEKFIALDTEFSREHTYYPKLCIVQIATASQIFIIDTLNIDLSPLKLLFLNKELLIVLHAGKQDLEIIYNIFNCLPNKIFDSQIAASFCSFGNAISYEKLVLELFNEYIDKSYRVSDWSKRPLIEQQLEYAKKDVIFLYKLYPLLLKKLEFNQRLQWAEEEFTLLNNPDNFIIDVNQAWTRIKHAQGLKSNLLLKKLATWREIKAQQNNIPRNHFLHEQHLIKLTETMPLNIDELQKIHYFSKFDHKLALEIIDLIYQTLKEQIDHDGDDYIVNINQLNKYKSLLRSVAQQHNIPAEIIANRSELKLLCSNGDWSKLRFSKGWRYNIFGRFVTQ